uniref:SAM-dependent MTase TRM10-type domain-containing protein n=1 Tax=Arundo donax TaxID=35708 RepID=A0A0A9ER39_ARUDO
MLKFVETRDWKTAFFHVIPQRKRGDAETEGDGAKVSLDDDDDDDGAAGGAANGDLSEEDLTKGFEEDADGDEEVEDDGIDVAKKRQCVRRENGEAGGHSSDAVAEATPAVDATPQAKESGDGGED